LDKLSGDVAGKKSEILRAFNVYRDVFKSLINENDEEDKLESLEATSAAVSIATEIALCILDIDELVKIMPELI